MALMLKKFFFTLILIVFSHTMFQTFCFAASVQTVVVHSGSMNKDINTLIIAPDYSNQKSAVVFLLHGVGGNHNSWLEISPELKFWADQFNVVFVCPDGENYLWLDSPIHASIRYETFITQELITYIDTSYGTFRENKKRAICGYDTGGNGALYIAAKYPAVFNSAGSTSGFFDLVHPKWVPLDISPKKDLNVSGVLGKKSKYRAERTMLRQAKMLKAANVNLILDCGEDDDTDAPYYTNKMHKILLKSKVAHTFVTSEGEHNYAYWRKSISHQILFFVNYFNGITD
ncbi:hypothetical protein FACS1894102_2570 [Spirochaetia bacterium]|nr:hypothetical protein FACS1894102_2570 [Spirochaetia bacterium]